MTERRCDGLMVSTLTSRFEPGMGTLCYVLGWDTLAVPVSTGKFIFGITLKLTNIPSS